MATTTIRKVVCALALAFLPGVALAIPSSFSYGGAGGGVAAHGLPPGTGRALVSLLEIIGVVSGILAFDTWAEIAVGRSDATWKRVVVYFLGSICLYYFPFVAAEAHATFPNLVPNLSTFLGS